MTNQDSSLDALLDLDGIRYPVDEDGKYWVKFEAKRVQPTQERPHGLKYSLTLHDEDNERILGFDNAHPVEEGSGPGARTRIEHDHRHAGDRVRFYEYSDAGALVTDFWKEVNAFLEKEGTK
jgi:hypothetical protein